MNEATIIFPHQLFADHPAIKKGRIIFLVEDPLFIGDKKYPAKFHKKKLTYQRACLKSYQDYLGKSKYSTRYINYQELYSDSEKLFKDLRNEKIDIAHFVDPVDFLIENRINKLAEKFDIQLKKYHSPSFLSEEDWLKEYFSDREEYFLTKFYIEQRKRLNILIAENQKPIGGKWSFDSENRKKLPKNVKVPEINFGIENEYVKAAKKYIGDNFPDNPGDLDNFYFPTNHREAKRWLNEFLDNRFNNFGAYQDAIVKNESFLFHSLLSPMINNGLLTPKDVVNKSIEYAEENGVDLNALEGFIRQIIGWREFIMAIYKFDGVHQRNSNFFDNQNPLPKSFYDGTTGIEPVDSTIKKLLRTGYSHHIERLMMLGNFMLLCEIHPTDVYKWFMEMYIDSYDWVMVPNVYGMSQFADGGLMSTKPYISSSNYILKMSDYKRGDWCEVWDGLFWRFINKHKNYFAENRRTFFMHKQLERMSKDKLDAHIKNADTFLEKLF